MTETGIIGRVIDVRSTTIRVSLDVGSKGFTKVGPDGLQTVGVVNSYITVPAGAHRVVGIVSGVYISGRDDQKVKAPLLSQDDTAAYELGATVVGRFGNGSRRNGIKIGFLGSTSLQRGIIHDKVYGVIRAIGK